MTRTGAPRAESELFGARAARTGLFVQAGGGTLLLDEIGIGRETLYWKLQHYRSPASRPGRITRRESK